MRLRPIALFMLAAAAMVPGPARSLGLSAVLPDGRIVSPAGFTTPVEGFASAAAFSPDGRYLAVLSQDGGAVDVLDLAERSALSDRLTVPDATAMTWNADGLFVARGYTGTVARFAFAAAGGKHAGTGFVKRPDLQVGASGLIDGVAEDPRTHRIAVARTAAREVVTLDDRSGAVLARRPTRGQPFAVAFVGDLLVATQYDATGIVAWRGDATARHDLATGRHPTQLLVAGDRFFVSDADGHDVVLVDARTFAIVKRYDLGLGSDPPPGQTPAGMALSTDGKTLYVTESGFDDVAVVDVGSGAVRARIPTGWYPTAVVARAGSTTDKDARSKEQLFVVSAKGLGSQPDPGGEWNGTYTGLVQHVVVEPERFDAWTQEVVGNDRLAPAAAARPLPPIKHVVFIVHENKHFDEVFGDEPHADADPALVVYGRTYTPNAHALAERYTLFDDFMSNGEASIFGHASTTQGMVNDYHERNAHSRDEGTVPVADHVPFSIWPYALAGEDTIDVATMDFDWFRNLADLPGPPRTNVGAIFGPRGELVDELQRKGVSFRVYGEQLTMEPDGRIAPGLAAHAVRAYPGAHIDYDVPDTLRAKIFLDDVAAHGLPAYAYLTLPTDHTAGKRPGFFTPASFVADNDRAFAQIVAGLSQRPEWRDTVIFSTCDDAQGTGDHVDSHRMPALAIGPYVRRGTVDHTRYSIPSILRTVEVLYGLSPLNIFDAAATPMYAAFAQQPSDEPYVPLAENVPMTRNPGKATAAVEPLDGPDDERIAREEWESIRGPRSLAATAAAAP